MTIRAMDAWTKVRNFVIDTYTNLTYKRAFDSPHRFVGSWVPNSDLRRLTSYRVLAAYRENAAREHLPTETEAQRREHREYGDPDLHVSRLVAGIVGDDMQIVVEGADADPPDTPVLPDAPDAPGEDANDVDVRVYEAALRVWQQRADDAIAEWEATWDELPSLRDRQEWLRQWAIDELFEQAVWECEGDVVGLGDGVYVLDLSTEENRPKLEVYDPGFYFPVLDEHARLRGFPLTVHVAFELDLDDDGQADHVRRITWQLGSILPQVDADFMPLFDDEQRVLLMDGDRQLDDGTIVRRYPWSLDEDSSVTCYKSDATWAINDVAGKKLGEFPDSTARYEWNEEGQPIRFLDLRLDFIPVIHVPNTPSRRDHFGKSSLSRTLQLFDDLADTDTDLQSAAALAGLPMVGVSGVTVPANITVRPGAMVGLGEKGSMDALDLSGSLTALLELKSSLEDRLGVNGQMPGEVSGRVEDTGAESGFARLLKLGPWTSLVNLHRLVREPKYALLLKFVQRMAQAGQILDAGPTLNARLAFGSFLPSDRKAVIDELVALMSAKHPLISRRTALQMLVDVGIDIGDIAEELARIDMEDLEAAERLFSATGRQDLVDARLGLTPAAEAAREEPPPVPELPPVA